VVSPTAATFYFYPAAKPSAGNPVEPVEPDLAFHQRFPKPSPGPSLLLWNLLRCTKASQTFSDAIATYTVMIYTVIPSG